MFFSLMQTLVCVLLINGSLYALHLTGGGGGGSGGSSSSSNANSPASLAASSSSSSSLNSNAALQHDNLNNMLNYLSSMQQQHAQHAGGGGGGVHKSHLGLDGRLSQELADMAQLDRERLMLLGLAKQTAAAGTGHHGRPIIPGRIQMTPDEEADYQGLLMQQARGMMYGNVVEAPTHTEDYESAEQYDGGGHSRPIKYEYGRVVQPAERESEPHHDVDFDALLEVAPNVDDYQYYEELQAEQHKNWEDVEWEAQAQALQAELDREQQHDEALKQLQQEAAGALKHRNGYNMQQKWQRKRAQQQQHQPQLQRNIFGHRKQLQQQQQHFLQQQQQQHHFNALPHAKVGTIANSETTATKHVGNTNNNSNNNKSPATAGAAAAMQSSSTSYVSAPVADAANTASAQHQHPAQKLQSAGNANGGSAATATEGASAGTSAGASSAQSVAEQKQEQLLHPNHKRSGAGAAAGAYGGLQSPVTHSIASQLMLRTARGQRQYDVPQIECPTAMDGMERFACPTPDLQGRYRCIDDHVLCDGFIDCPEGEDEDRRSCMFYKTTKAHLDVLADALLRWARGR